jgi:hypothetical protein
MIEHEQFPARRPDFSFIALAATTAPRLHPGERRSRRVLDRG